MTDACEHSTSNPKRARRELPPVPDFACDDPLMTAQEAAAFRRQGLSTFWRDVRNGTVRQPLRITPKAPRWRRSWLLPKDFA